MKHEKHIWGKIAAFAVAATFSASAQDFYLSPLGDDNGPGSQARPFRSLARARDAVRKVNKAMTRDIVVYLRGGEYGMTNAVEFDSQDSGVNGHAVVYRAFQNEKPVLSGGIALRGWKLHDVAKNIYRAAAPRTGFRQLYINGKRGIRARAPNRESPTTFGPYWKIRVVSMTEMRIDRRDWDTCKGIENLDEVEVALFAHWYHLRLFNTYTPGDTDVVVVPVKPAHRFSHGIGFYGKSFFFLENALAFVDAPGEWYHDPRKAIVYLAVPKGSDPNALRVTIPRLENLVAIRGTPEKLVENLVFEGVTFECSNWLSPSRQGLNVTQFAQPAGVDKKWENPDYPPGIIRVAHARRIVFRNNVIRNTGAHGIQFFMNVDDSDIEGNQFCQIAADGIEIDAHAERKPPPDKQSTGVAIWNNLITQAGQDYSNGGGILAHNVRGLIVEHNRVYDMPYSGMQIGDQSGGGKRGLADVGCGDNRIRYNHVHHCMQLHDDGGGIYTLGGIQTGTVIAENYIHDIKRSEWAGGYWVDAIYLDNATSAIRVKDNVVTGSRAAERNFSRGNTLQDNTQGNPKVEQNAGIKPGYKPERK